MSSLTSSATRVSTAKLRQHPLDLRKSEIHDTAVGGVVRASTAGTEIRGLRRTEGRDLNAATTDAAGQINFADVPRLFRYCDACICCPVSVQHHVHAPTRCC